MEGRDLFALCLILAMIGLLWMGQKGGDGMAKPVTPPVDKKPDDVNLFFRTPLTVAPLTVIVQGGAGDNSAVLAAVEAVGKKLDDFLNLIGTELPGIKARLDAGTADLEAAVDENK